jgi:hypothetical protein
MLNNTNFNFNTWQAIVNRFRPKLAVTLVKSPHNKLAKGPKKDGDSKWSTACRQISFLLPYGIGCNNQHSLLCVLGWKSHHLFELLVAIFVSATAVIAPVPSWECLFLFLCYFKSSFYIYSHHLFELLVAIFVSATAVIAPVPSWEWLFLFLCFFKSSFYILSFLLKC